MTNYIFEAINRTNHRVDAVVKIVKRQETKQFWNRIAIGVLAFNVYRLSKEVKALKDQKDRDYYEEEGE